jgi:uncharacterized membrane protein
MNVENLDNQNILNAKPYDFMGWAGFMPNQFPFFWSTDMLSKNSVIALFDQHTQAEKAVKELQESGFDMKSLSIVGKDYHTDEHVVGYYTTGDRMKYWGKNGAFWGGIWGMLFGSAFFMIPGIGPLVAAGPIVAWIVAGLEGAAVVGGLSALGAGLYSIGIPKKSILQYESSLKAGKFMLVAHGTPDEVTRGKEILSSLGASETQLHIGEATVSTHV